MKKYLIRLDDACPTMNHQLWGRMESLLDKYGIKPMVGVIPHNEDSNQMIDIPDELFWGKVHIWQNKGWAIALHGYNHCYTSDKGLKGLNPLWRRSEFAGLSLEEQRKKIKGGVSIMRHNGINPTYFFAPSHTFDNNTLTALKTESDIRIISDTVANKPYKYKGFVFLPQVGGHCSEIELSGYWTFCLHPNTMSEDAFQKTEKFIENHKDAFISFDQLDLSNVKGKNLVSKLMSGVYFTYRRIRGIK